MPPKYRLSTHPPSGVRKGRSSSSTQRGLGFDLAAMNAVFPSPSSMSKTSSAGPSMGSGSGSGARRRPRETSPQWTVTPEAGPRQRATTFSSTAPSIQASLLAAEKALSISLRGQTISSLESLADTEPMIRYRLVSIRAQQDKIATLESLLDKAIEDEKHDEMIKVVDVDLNRKIDTHAPEIIRAVKSMEDLQQKKAKLASLIDGLSNVERNPQFLDAMRKEIRKLVLSRVPELVSVMEEGDRSGSGSGDRVTGKRRAVSSSSDERLKEQLDAMSLQEERGKNKMGRSGPL